MLTEEPQQVRFRAWGSWPRRPVRLLALQPTRVGGEAKARFVGMLCGSSTKCPGLLHAPCGGEEGATFRALGAGKEHGLIT